MINLPGSFCRKGHITRGGPRWLKALPSVEKVPLTSFCLYRLSVLIRTAECPAKQAALGYIKFGPTLCEMFWLDKRVGDYP